MIIPTPTPNVKNCSPLYKRGEGIRAISLNLPRTQGKARNVRTGLLLLQFHEQEETSPVEEVFGTEEAEADQTGTTGKFQAVLQTDPATFLP